MKHVAIFYHCRLSCDDPIMSLDHTVPILQEQMSALRLKGLSEEADYFYIGVNGGGSDFMAASMLSPANADKVEHPSGARGELPTLHALQQWLPGHEDWLVFYHHIKGATHPGNNFYASWRRCMERHLVFDWRRCVSDLESGFDSVGCHWLTPEKYPGLVKSPFWGGNFWWATASFLKTLPPIIDTARNRDEFYNAESWIGWGPKRPNVMDYARHWPGEKC